MRLISTSALFGLAAFAVAACASNDDPAPMTLAEFFHGKGRPVAAESYSAFLVARYASLTNDPASAMAGYERAFDAMPEHVELAERAVFAALLAGEYDDALRLSRAAETTQRQNSALVRLTLAIDAINSGNLNRADAIFAQDDFGAFNAAMVTNMRAWIALERGGVEEARAILLNGQVDDGVLDSVTLYMLGLIYMSEGDNDAALGVLQTVGDTGPRLAMATEAEARLLVLRGERTRAVNVLSAFRREAGPNPALDTLRTAIQAGEDVRQPQLNLRQGAALSVYVPAAALAAQNTGDLSGVYFALALALDPDLDIARTLWANALDSAGRRDDALRILSEIEPSSAFYATARGQMAWVYRRGQHNDAALAVAAEALAAQPDRDLSVQLGDLFTTLGRDGEAEIVFSDVIAYDRARGEADWRILLARGAARERLGRWPEAEADLRTAMTLSPDNPDILNHLGYSLIDRGTHLEEGMRLISRAVDLRPRSGTILDSLGWAHYQLGGIDRAVLHLERAVELQPGDVVINDHLGDAYWQADRRLEARFQWQRALSLARNGEDTREIEDKLAGAPPVAPSHILPASGQP